MRKIIHVDMDCFFNAAVKSRQSRPARYPYCSGGQLANDGG